MSRKILALLLVFLLGLTVVACGGEAETPAEETAEEVEEVAEEAAEEAAMETFTIGVSNGFVASEWRTQMIQNLEAINAEFMEAGLATELVVESADTDVQGQIQQIQNLINRGVDAIIINPNDQTALNPVIEEATEQGIVVIAIDQEISANGAINVVIDQTEWARISAQWLAEELGGEGDVVLIEGFVGHPANEARMAGVDEVFAEYPGINVVGRDTGQWDQATGQQVMSDFLASLPNIDGVWTQDGMAQGALQAIMTADPEEWPVLAGEARAGYMKLWNEILEEGEQDFSTIGVVNPPGVAVAGYLVAMELLQGHELDTTQLVGPFNNSIYIPIADPITNDNFEAEFAEIADQPDSYVLDDIITQDEAAALVP